MNRFPGLDLLRAIAIAWVMLFHSFIVGGLGQDFAWLSRYGWIGVDIFFVLSGFLIGTQVLKTLERGDRFSFGGFYARRAYRILPAFAVVLACYVIFPGLRESPGLQPWWQFATFTMNLLIDYTHNQAFSHAWSLCVEEHFYLLFPLLAWWLTRRPSAMKFAMACAVVVLLGIALRSAVWWHDSALDPPRNWFIEDIYYPTWMRLDGLLMGVMLAAWSVYRPQSWARWQARANGVLLGGLAVVGLAFWLFRDRVGLLGNCHRLAAAVVRAWTAGVCRSRSHQRDRTLADTGCGLDRDHFLQPVPQPQDRVPRHRNAVRRRTRRPWHARLPGLRAGGVAGGRSVALRRRATVPAASGKARTRPFRERHAAD